MVNISSYGMMDDHGRNSPSNLSRSSSLRSSGSNRTSLVRRNQSMSAKQIRFYRNGDRYFSGLKLAVSPERYKEFDSLLAELSEKVNLSTGAVRFIFNAEDNSIITDISQLYNGISYVCSSTNTFRQLEGGYGKHMYSWSVISKSKEQSKPHILGNVENFHHIAFRSESSRDFIKPKLVTVIRNGKPPQKKVTLLLNSKTAVSLNQVLDQLSAKGSLGKVDKLCSVDGRGIKTLRDLFDDDTVFIALSANEKFPEDGIELDPNSRPGASNCRKEIFYYRITPYRELKRPCNVNVRRANSMRVRKVKDENENLSLTSVSRSNQSPNGKSLKNGNAKVARPRSATSRKIEQNKDELYPTSVFESDSESAKTKKGKQNRRAESRNKSPSSMDIYNTVWLSDFESVKSFGSQSGLSSLNQSKIESFVDNIYHSSPKIFPDDAFQQIGWCRQCQRKSSTNYLHRTLSLPEFEFSQLQARDLQERFSQLQLEQENKELRLLVDQLQGALETIEQSMQMDINGKNAYIFKNTLNSIKQQTQQPHKQLSVGNSLDSLDESYPDHSDPNDMKDRNESGYNSTFYQDSSGNICRDEKEDDDFKKPQKRHEDQYSDYTDDDRSDSDENFYESRLTKNKRLDMDETNCCVIH